MKYNLFKLEIYNQEHFNFIEKIYLKHDSKDDSEEGNATMIDFISTKNSNERIKEGSLFYKIVTIENKLIGVFELDENHLTLLYINTQEQKSGIGTSCINEMKNILKEKYTELTVFSSLSAVDFYNKNNFVKMHEEIREIQGMKYYLMELEFE